MRHIAISILISLSAIVAGSSSVSAQWISSEIEDPFGESDVLFAATVRSGRMLGIRCVGGKQLELVFAPNEQGDSSVASMANALQTKLLVRIDDSDIETLDATTTSHNGKIVSASVIQKTLAERIATAKRRVAAVLEMMGQKFGTQSFGVSGSGREITKVLRACGHSE